MFLDPMVGESYLDWNFVKPRIPPGKASMKTQLLAMILLSSLLVRPAGMARAAGEQAGRIRIACVGNSITFGDGIINRDVNSYPAQLQAILGDGLRRRQLRQECSDAFAPGRHPVHSAAGIRTGARVPPEHRLHRTRDERQQAAQPRRQRCLSPGLSEPPRELPAASDKAADRAPPAAPLLLHRHDWTSATNTSASRSSPGCAMLRTKPVVEVVNLYNYFLDQGMWFPDHVHPSSVGAGLIAIPAVRSGEARSGRSTRISPDWLDRAAVRSNYYGFECADFSVRGERGEDRPPKEDRERRTRGSGEPGSGDTEPQTEIALLERGFHVAYCDVAELFGNDEAIDIWNRFYESLTRAGFSPKPAMEGFSRGGVYVYRWAVSQPHARRMRLCRRTGA